ncbi:MULTISPECIES: GNAT family N-acetyltransferase [Priestia]|uniref:GNAT family N-acetyltransferase n=1 Tax=Priestia TaxID=2800373 RepID=UPI0005EC8F71|nr:GNAT family N-acetyltransferase [Priestia aryabhattai]KJL06023.1 GNAT family acetyltransferase [Priestia aryabhattai B8W22]MED3898383.1 GNAT family N-acetyltransferase [Priestia aryabhattai]
MIRQGRVGDEAGIANVHVESWKSTYKGIVPDSFLNSLNAEKRKPIWKKQLESNSVVVAEENGQIVGFASYGKERTNKYPSYTGELYAMYLLTEHQRKGIGKALMHKIAQELGDQDIHTMLTWAFEENGACQFYEALGGKRIDRADVIIDGTSLSEVAFGWDTLKNL